MHGGEFRNPFLFNDRKETRPMRIYKNLCLRTMHAGSSFAQLMQVCVTSGSEWSEFQKVLFENRYLHSAHPVNLQIINALCFQRRNQEKLLWLQNAGLKTNRADCFLVVDCGPGGH